MTHSRSHSKFTEEPRLEATALSLAILEPPCGGEGPTYEALVGAAGQVLRGIF